MKKIILFCILCFASTLYLSAQQFTIGIKLTGLSIHPWGATNAHLMRYKLDERGIFVFNPGIRLSFEYFVYRDIASIKFDMGLYADCANQFAGFFHVGLRGKIFNIDDHSFNGGMGPTFFFRRNWYRLNGYIDDIENFRGNPDDYWQWWFIWYGGEFEYNYRVNETLELSTSIVPVIGQFVPFIINPGIRLVYE